MTTASNGQADLIAFLDYLKGKGLMNGATASARKAAVKTLFSVLDDSETADVTTLNLDDVSMRFLNKRGGEFKPASVKVYKSRVASAIEDLKRYRADPLNFKVGITAKPPVKSEKSSASKEPPVAVTASQPQVGAFVSPSEIVFPIPIRPNSVVKIVGLPSDLTKQEATRIANVIHALASGDDF